jgi:hypothetical protein
LTTGLKRRATIAQRSAKAGELSTLSCFLVLPTIETLLRVLSYLCVLRLSQTFQS